MACQFEITLSNSEPAGVSLAQQALDKADHLEQQLTIFRDTSEVSLVNRYAASEPVQISSSLFRLLQLCLNLYQETQGAFDITSSPLSHCWGFIKRAGRIPLPEELEEAKLRVGSDKLALDSRSRTIAFIHSGVCLNLGSIGKGYALDCMKEFMQAKVRAALLNAGASSFYAIGDGAGLGGWEIGIRHPKFLERRMAWLRLNDVAMATSGSEEQFFEHEGKRFGHIIDPRSGLPAESVASVTVVAKSAAIADALATAFYVGGRTLAETYCELHDDILVVLLESEADLPIILGNRQLAEVEILHA
ncbi:MAG: FAD:protein FMN transferase [Acidobacteriota bacterium]